MAPGGHWLSVESTPSSSSYQGTLIKAALSRFLSRDFPLLLVFIFFSIIWRRRRKRTQRRPTRTKGRRRSRKVCLGALAPSRLLFDNGNHNESKKLKERRGNGEKVLLDFLSGKSCLSVLSCFFLIVCVCVCRQGVLYNEVGTDRVVCAALSFSRRSWLASDIHRQLCCLFSLCLLRCSISFWTKESSAATTTYSFAMEIQLKNSIPLSVSLFFFTRQQDGQKKRLSPESIL